MARVCNSCKYFRLKHPDDRSGICNQIKKTRAVSKNNFCRHYKPKIKEMIK